MFVAGYSVRSSLIQRVFALVELMRAVAAFMTAPVILHLAMTVDEGVTGGGIKAGLWVCFAIVVTAAGLAVLVFLLGGARLQQPDLERWQEGEQPAWDSPPLLEVPRRLSAAAHARSRVLALPEDEGWNRAQDRPAPDGHRRTRAEPPAGARR